MPGEWTVKSFLSAQLYLNGCECAEIDVPMRRYEFHHQIRVTRTVLLTRSVQDQDVVDVDLVTAVCVEPQQQTFVLHCLDVDDYLFAVRFEQFGVVAVSVDQLHRHGRRLPRGVMVDEAKCQAELVPI